MIYTFEKQRTQENTFLCPKNLSLAWCFYSFKSLARKGMYPFNVPLAQQGLNPHSKKDDSTQDLRLAAQHHAKFFPNVQRG